MNNVTLKINVTKSSDKIQNVSKMYRRAMNYCPAAQSWVSLILKHMLLKTYSSSMERHTHWRVNNYLQG